MKKIITSFSLLIVLFLIISPTVSAQNGMNSLEDLEKKRQEAEESLEELRQAKQGELLEKGKQHGLNAIDQRVLSIERAQSRITANERLSAENKEEIQNNLSLAESGLNILRTEMQNESELDQLRVHVQNIFYNYRIYAVELPKDHGLMACGVIEYLINEKLTTVDDRLEEIVTTLKEAGKDTTTLEGLIEEFSSYIISAQSDLESAKTEFRSALPAEDLTGPRAHILAGKEHLLNARSNLRLAKETLQKIVEEVRTLKAN